MSGAISYSAALKMDADEIVEANAALDIHAERVQKGGV